LRPRVTDITVLGAIDGQSDGEEPNVRLTLTPTVVEEVAQQPSRNPATRTET
jgi:hypothetical protein